MNELARLEGLNRRIVELTRERDGALKRLREKCKHLQLVEIDYSCLYSDAPPFRICADCGAEERGWYCGYQVLVLWSENANIPRRRRVRRVIIKSTQSADVFYSYRKTGPLYMVGQSHPNFARGAQTYKQLTAV